MQEQMQELDKEIAKQRERVLDAQGQERNGQLAFFIVRQLQGKLDGLLIAKRIMKVTS